MKVETEKSDDLKLKTKNRMVPDALYNQCHFIENPRVFYAGMQDQYFTMSMFQLQGFYMRGKEVEKWTKRDSGRT